MTHLTDMLASLPLVLAEGEVAGVIFFVIWVVVALVSTAQKKKQKRTSQLPPPEDRTSSREQVTRPQDRTVPRGAVPPMPPRINPPKPSPLPPRKMPAAKIMPPRLPAPVEEPVWQPMKDMVQSQWAQTTTRSSQIQVMLQPATVRQGIVLAEILRPPLALREEEHPW